MIHFQLYFYFSIFYSFTKRAFKDFSDIPVVKTSSSNEAADLMPNWGPKIPHASQPKTLKRRSNIE